LARLHLRSAAGWASQALGILVLATAGLMAVGADTALSADLTSTLPDWTGTLQTIERSNPVQSALGDLSAGGSTASSVPGQNQGSGPLAPDFAGIDHWLNSSPLTMSGLRGKVVLVDFWTYSCINCIRTLPYVESWYQKYAADGLVIVGVHTPEFAFEHDTGNVTAAIARFGITYPVAQDNEFQTWAAYNNQYWPADYLIDAGGHIRETHFGEGDYAKTEASIRTLLSEAGSVALPTPGSSEAAPPFGSGQTPETYLGSDRSSSLANRGSTPAGTGTFIFPGQLADDAFALNGTFDVQPEYITATTSGDQLEISFQARDVYLVMAADTPVPVTVKVTGANGAQGTEEVGVDGSLTVGPARLYHLVHLSAAARGTVTITFNASGAHAYAFTFGS
jgi:thiol-disulfide isomerase/thioredoxin